MKFYRFILITLLFGLLFPLISNADPLEDAKSAIENEDFETAQKLLQPLADEDNQEATTLLGALYVNGQGVEKDFNKGLSMIMKAAKKGYGDAKLKAFKVCLDLGKEGDPSAMYNVGYMCLNGWGGEYDSNVCMEWLETAGKLGHEKSARFLNKIYTEGMYGVTPDENKASYWEGLPAAFASGLDGKWTGSMDFGMGRPTKMTYNFKTEGDTLTGTIIGFQGKKDKIQDGKIDGNNLSFMVESNFMGKKNKTNYSGIFLGDTIKLTLTREMERGESPPPTTFDITRAD